MREAVDAALGAFDLAAFEQAGQGHAGNPGGAGFVSRQVAAALGEAFEQIVSSGWWWSGHGRI